MADRKGTPGLWERWQLAIGGGFLLVSALAFVLGMWVGRDVSMRHPLQPERVVKLDAPERPSAAEIPRPVGRKFFDELRDEISNELVGEDASGEEPKQVRAKPTHTARRVPPTSKRKPTATRTLRAPTKARPTKAKPTKVVAGGPWFVRVGATTELDKVLRWAVLLRRMGLISKTVETKGGGTRFLRVRLGPFATHEEAVAVLAKVHSEPRFKTAYVTSQ